MDHCSGAFANVVGNVGIADENNFQTIYQIFAATFGRLSIPHNDGIDRAQGTIVPIAMMRCWLTVPLLLNVLLSFGARLTNSQPIHVVEVLDPAGAGQNGA
jgi:hypothetical protein